MTLADGAPRTVPGGGELVVHVIVRQDVARLLLEGELDVAAVTRLRDVVGSVLDVAGVARLDLDAAALSFVDSMGLRALLLCREDAAIAGVAWRLVAVSPALDRLLSLAGLFHLVGSPDAN